MIYRLPAHRPAVSSTTHLLGISLTESTIQGSVKDKLLLYIPQLGHISQSNSFICHMLKETQENTKNRQ